jgi:hypothetical protein
VQKGTTQLHVRNTHDHVEMEIIKKGFNNSKQNKQTFKPTKQHDKGTKRHNLHKQAKATLGSGNLKAAVKLPPGEDIDEWLAVNSMIAPLRFCRVLSYTYM